MKPILIYKGDDTIFADLRRFLTFNIETNLDLTGWKAKFTLGWITREISDISSKSFEIILSSEETKNLRLGSQSGSIVLTDSRGHIKTITNSIPFEVTTQVVENEYQEIDLSIPESAEVDIKLKVGSGIVTSINGKEGDVILTAQDVGALPDTTIIPDISNLATKEELQDGLDTKQPTGDYALKSEIPDTTNLATKTELQNGLNNKQDKGDYALKSEIPTDNNQLANGAGYITSEYHDNTKQDVINDLDTIRSGASKGATALQSVPAEYVTETELNAKGYLTSYTETDPIYTADKPNLALKTEIPTKVSSLTNDANYQTATDVASMIASIPQFELKIVEELPATGQRMVLYLIPKTSAGGDDIYDEYIWIESTSSFELVGSTTVDLSDYYTKSQTDVLLNNKQNKGNYAKTDTINTFIAQQQIQSGAAAGALIIGADVDKNTLTNGERKLARIAMPLQEDITKTMLLISADTYKDGQTTIETLSNDLNRIEFGGRLGSATTVSPDSMGFTVAKVHNSMSSKDKIYAMEMNAKQVRFNVRPNYVGDNLVTEAELSLYKKISSPMTEAEYEALVTKDPNTLYLIEE